MWFESWLDLSLVWLRPYCHLGFCLIEAPMWIKIEPWQTWVLGKLGT